MCTLALAHALHRQTQHALHWLLRSDFYAHAQLRLMLSTGMVEGVEPRRSELADPPVANVDLVVLVFSVHSPPFDPTNMCRYIIASEAANLPVILVLNKSDLVPEQEMDAFVQQASVWPSPQGS